MNRDEIIARLAPIYQEANDKVIQMAREEPPEPKTIDEYAQRNSYFRQLKKCCGVLAGLRAAAEALGISTAELLAYPICIKD